MRSQDRQNVLDRDLATQVFVDKILLGKNVHQVVDAVIEGNEVVLRRGKPASNRVVDVRLKSLVPNNDRAKGGNVLLERAKKRSARVIGSHMQEISMDRFFTGRSYDVYRILQGNLVVGRIF